jgi:CSLREA domain-containing protein
MHRVRSAALVACVVAIAAVGPAPSARAATFTVTSTADAVDANSPGPFDGVCAAAGGGCTLRAAIQEADATPEPDLIVLPGGTYPLTIEGDLEDDSTEGDLDISTDVTIVGAGAVSTLVAGAWPSNPDRLFHDLGTLTLSGVTLQGGAPSGVQSNGGAIFVSGGVLNLADSVVTGNSSPIGGGINNYGTATLTGVTISGNSSTIGGGIRSDDPMTLTNVTISGNSATSSGGGIHSSGGAQALNNVTVVGNVADSDDSGGGDGGGLSGLFAGAFELRNTLIGGNSDGSTTGNVRPDCSATVTSNDHNLVRDPTGCAGLASPGDVIGQDPLVGALADHGGATPTHALLPGSPAIDAGGADCAPNDQRGAPRGTCDIGAYELVRCRGIVVNRVGTEGGDTLVGTGLRDGLLGLGGKDTLKGSLGADGLCGGAGKDTLRGENGMDRLDGGKGKDTCIGGAKKDKARKCETARSVP